MANDVAVSKVICPMCGKKAIMRSGYLKLLKGHCSTIICYHCGYHKESGAPDFPPSEGVHEYVGINHFKRKRNKQSKTKFYKGDN